MRTFSGFASSVTEPDDCYRTLGLVHQLYKPMPGRFKDYIAIPRVNGYQSLHTTLFGPNGMPLEVQIRTEGMDRLAERGIAAHWQYKAVEKQTHSAEARAREWLAGLMEMHHVEDSEEFLETVKVDLFPGQGLRFYTEGRDSSLAPRGHGRRFCLCRAYGGRQSLCCREDRSSARPPTHRVEQRANGRDHHCAGCQAESELGQLCSHG